jgi:preprotein translocase subunit YajC
VKSSTISGYLFFLIIAAFLYFFLLRPQQRRARSAQQVTKALQPGQEVMTTAGLFGVIRTVTDDHVELEIAPGVVVRYVKAAIARVVPLDDTTMITESGRSSTDGDASDTGSGTTRDADSSDETEPGTKDGPEPGA